MNEFIKFAGHKLGIQKSTAFLYNRNEQSKKGFKETISFTIAFKY